jgi:hypothetical protein
MIPTKNNAFSFSEHWWDDGDQVAFSPDTAIFFPFREMKIRF